jgi:SAM-dependent methyltransferase
MEARVNSKEININEIDYHRTSFCDQAGRVFWWQGELYRGITTAHATFYQRLFANGTIGRLAARQLMVDTELTDLTVADYSLVLKHQRLPFVSYANEWSPTMLRDAALLVTDLMLELAKEGLTLSDASTFDILFEGPRPLYVDVGTIIDADYDGDRTWHYFRQDFHSYFLEPLRLMAQGQGRLARWLLAEYDHDVMEEFIALQETRSASSRFGKMPNRLLAKLRNRIPQGLQRIAPTWGRFLRLGLSRLSSNGDQYLFGLDMVRRMRQEVEAIEITPADSDSSFVSTAAASAKADVVHSLLSRLRPATVLDIGCGAGRFAAVAAALGSQVVALDADERCVDACRQRALKEHLPILALVMNLRNPSPSQGICNTVLSSAFERLACEFGLALDLVHLLVLQQQLTFAQLADTFASFSKQWLLVEFVHSEDDEIRQAKLSAPEWYTLTNFAAELRRCFQSIEIVPCDLAARTLLLCKK